MPTGLQEPKKGGFEISLAKDQPLTNRARGPYWGILARGRDSTDRASRGPYKNDRGPILPSTARGS